MREFDVERAMGIEPTALAWEARVLPLYDARSGEEVGHSMLIGPAFQWLVAMVSKCCQMAVLAGVEE